MKRPLILFLLVLVAGNAYALSRKCELAEKLYLQGSYRSAVYECESLFREYRKGDLKIEAAYIAGLSYLKLENLPKAKKYFRYVLDKSKDPLLLSEAQIGLDNVSKKEASSVDEPSLFSIQMGSFKDKKNANRLYKRFKRRRYTVRITKEKDGRVTIYKVKIGKFKSKEEAAKFAKKLNKEGYQTAIVAY